MTALLDLVAGHAGLLLFAEVTGFAAATFWVWKRRRSLGSVGAGPRTSELEPMAQSDEVVPWLTSLERQVRSGAPTLETLLDQHEDQLGLPHPPMRARVGARPANLDARLDALERALDLPPLAGTPGLVRPHPPADNSLETT